MDFPEDNHQWFNRFCFWVLIQYSFSKRMTFAVSCKSSNRLLWGSGWSMLKRGSAICWGSHSSWLWSYAHVQSGVSREQSAHPHLERVQRVKKCGVSLKIGSSDFIWVTRQPVPVWQPTPCAEFTYIKAMFDSHIDIQYWYWCSICNFLNLLGMWMCAEMV